MRYTEIVEAPIDNLVVQGDLDYSDNPRLVPGSNLKLSRSGYTAADKSILTNPNSVKKLRNAFERTPFVFDFYVFLNGLTSNIYGKKWTAELLASVTKQPIKTDGKITVVYTNNATGQYFPLTPWIMAHRMAHALQTKHDYWPHERGFWKAISSVGDEVGLHIHIGNSALNPVNQEGTKLAAAMMTMKSARRGVIRNDLDFYGEIVAQFLLTGRVRFARFADWNENELHIDCDEEALDQAIAEAEEETNRVLQGQFEALVGQIISF